MSRDGAKHVQTALDSDEYESFRRLADEQGLSLKEAMREALAEWVERQRRVDPEDPAFTILEELEELSGHSTDARHENDLVEAWDGETVDSDSGHDS